MAPGGFTYSMTCPCSGTCACSYATVSGVYAWTVYVDAAPALPSTPPLVGSFLRSIRQISETLRALGFNPLGRGAPAPLRPREPRAPAFRPEEPRALSWRARALRAR